jgi:hypothetical protein
MVGALTPGALAVVIIPSHHEQGGWASFEIRDEEGSCFSDSLRIEMARKGSDAPCPTTYTVGEIEAA